jgi:hypothetical protein
MLAAAIAIPVSGFSALAISGQAGAAAKITCLAFNGSVSSGQVQAQSCSGGNTGGSSQELSIAVLGSGGNVPWTMTPNNTTFGAPTEKTVAATKCPGYVKHASSNPSAVSFKGAVTADSGDGLKIPGKYAGEVCISNDADGTITALKKLTVT